jgi:ceramide glucosyltransferase
VIAAACGLALFVWSYAVATTVLYGAGRAALQRRSGAPRDLAAIRTLVVRPCAGTEPHLERALASLARARSTAAIACRIAVESASDPAEPIARRAAAALERAGLDARVVLTAADAPNHKAAQIAAVLAAERGPFDAIVIADSDVDLDGFDLDALLGPLFEYDKEYRKERRLFPPETPDRRPPRTGAVWAPPVEVGASAGAGDRASAAVLSGSLHAFTILGALERVLGEDMELARRLAAAGHGVRVAPMVARSLKSGRTWRCSVERYARWLTVIRAQRPRLLVSYPLLFLATPLILAGSALVAPFAPAPALAAAVLAVTSRLCAAVCARLLAGLGLSLAASTVDAVLADALLAHAFARALAARTVTWRGRALTIDRRGALDGARTGA